MKHTMTSGIETWFWHCEIGRLNASLAIYHHPPPSADRGDRWVVRPSLTWDRRA